MPIINLKKYYYPAYTKDTFVEVSDEVAEALLLMGREENARKSKIYYHKAYFSLDYGEGIENVNANLKMSFFAGQYTSVYSLNRHITCRFEPVKP